MANLQRLLEQANLAYNNGKLVETEQLCEQVLATQPKAFDAVHLLALAQTRSGQYPKALASYDRALAIQAGRTDAWSNRGLVLHAMERYDEALTSYDRALKLQPNGANALFNRGNTLYVLGRLEEALEAYDRVLQVQPRNAKILCNRGATLYGLRRFEAAVESCDQALAVQPRNAEAHINRAVALHELKCYDEAVASCDTALSLSPNHPEALRARGNSLHSLGRSDDALASFDKAIALNPNHAEAHYSRGVLLVELGRMQEAIASFDKAIALNPSHAEAHYSRGMVFIELRRLLEAITNFDRAIALYSTHAKAHHGRGEVLSKLKDYDQAFTAYDRAYALNHDLPGLEGARLNAKMYACDWNNFENESAHLISSIRDGKPNSTPFAFLIIPSSAADQFQCAKSWVQIKFPASERATWQGQRYQHDRIRLAYLSADFRVHPVAQVLSDLLEQHDRSRFEIIGLSTGPDDASPLRGRIVKSLEHFHDVRTINDEQAAQLIRELEVDILVKVAPHTEYSRIGILAHRPAPIQVNGFSAWTSGADFVDYVLADPRALSFAEQCFFTEQIVHLPDSYFSHDSTQQIAATAATRTDFGLPEDGFVFCSFNKSYKLNPRMFDIWMRLLRRIDGSVLWLAQINPHATTNLRREAEARDVDPFRLIFAPRMPSLGEHLARHRAADLFLDTVPYGAHTTAKDALWAGLPVLTCRGDTFVGRIAVSQLHAIGLPELITDTLDEYEAAALRLAQNPDELRALRNRLAANRDSHPLFNTRRLCRHFEAAYSAMYERHQAGLPPAQLCV